MAIWKDGFEKLCRIGTNLVNSTAEGLASQIGSAGIIRHSKPRTPRLRLRVASLRLRGFALGTSRVTGRNLFAHSGDGESDFFLLAGDADAQ